MRNRKERRRKGATDLPEAWNEVADVARSLVQEHGWAKLSLALTRMITDALDGNDARRSTPQPDSRVAPLFAAIAKVPRSAWAPLLLPVAAGLAVTAAPVERARGAYDTVTDEQLENWPVTIPIREHRLGPLSRSRQRRAIAVLGALQVAGLGQLAGTSDAQRAFGMGLMAPGAGFAYTKDPLLLLISGALFASTLVLWIGNGNHVAPPLVWLGAAGIAASRAKEGNTFGASRLLVPLAIAGAAAAWKRKYDVDYTQQLEAAKATNQYLETVTPRLRGDDRPAVHVGPELTEDELALTRYLVDIALQEPDDWRHYDIREQFQPAAVRYQINCMVWALAQQQYARTPAFHGYLSDAQIALNERYLQRKVWSYWYLENMWGNLELNPDPVRRQNVMLSGWYGLQLAAYQSATGDLRYTKPGSVTFRWNEDEAYEYDLLSMSEAVVKDLEASPWGLIVCEPNWIYGVCNTTAGNTFRILDRMNGTDFWDRTRGNFVRGLDEEFVRVDGMMNGFKSSRVGLAHGKSPGPAVELRPLAPHLADRYWALMSAGAWQRGEDGSVASTALAAAPPMLDFGNYAMNKLFGYGGLIKAAMEFGEPALAAATWKELLEQDPPIRENGRLRFKEGSVLAHSMLAQGLWSRKAGWLDLVERGLPEAWQEGPLLASVPYPAVLVARAETDGTALDVVLRSTGAGRHTVQLARLRPGGRYRLNGAVEPDVTAGPDGTAAVTVEIDGRLELGVRPGRLSRGAAAVAWADIRLAPFVVASCSSNSNVFVRSGEVVSSAAAGDEQSTP